MKLLALTVVAFIVGFAFGGWPPRSDLYALRGEMEKVKAQLADKAYSGNPSLSGITQMLNVPKPAAPATPQPEAAVEEADEPTETVASDETEPVAEQKPGPREPVDFREHIEQAADLWGMRSDLARQSFLDTVAASEEQALRFDVVMEAMNVRLEASITHWAGVLAEDAMPPTEAGIRMMKDITEALALAYDDLDQSLPGSWKRDAGKSFEIVDYIDPLVALPLAGVQDKLDFR